MMNAPQGGPAAPVIPQIGALPPVPSAVVGSPSGLGNFAEAIGNLPDLIKKRQLAQAEQQDQIQTIAQKRLQHLAQVGLSQPGVEHNPQYVEQVKQTYKMLNLPVPMNEQGGIDVHALMPHRTWEEVTDDEKMKGLGLPPEARAALFTGVDGIPPEYLKAKMSTALNATAVSAAQRLLAQKATDLGTGKITPAEFAGIVKANANTLGDSAQYYLSDEFLRDTIGASTTASIAKLDALGIHYKNMDKLRSRWLDNQLNEFHQTLGEKKRMDDSTIANRAAMDNYRTQQLGLAQQRLEQGQQRISIAMQNSSTMASRASIAGFTQLLAPVEKHYNDTQHLYNQTLTQIQSAVNNNVTPDPKLLDQATALKTSLDSMSDTMNQAHTLLGQAPGRAAAAVTGQPVTHAGTNRIYGTAKNGKPIYSDDDGVHWHFQK